MIAQLDQSFAFRRSLVPVKFETFLAEPAFSLEETTFCIWRRYVDTALCVGPINYPDADDPDGSEYLLSILDGRPSIYKEFAEPYYEKKLDIDAIEQIYHLEILTTKIISGLNGEITLQSLTSGRGGRGSRSVPSGRSVLSLGCRGQRRLGRSHDLVSLFGPPQSGRQKPPIHIHRSRRPRLLNRLRDSARARTAVKRNRTQDGMVEVGSPNRLLQR
jgi:hypothetical protein